MTLRLDLPPDLEQRLTAEAGRLGLAPDQCALRVLGQHLPLKEGPREFLALVRSWMEEDDPDEQKETFEYLVRVLDEDRPSRSGNCFRRN